MVFFLVQGHVFLDCTIAENFKIIEKIERQNLVSQISLEITILMFGGNCVDQFNYTSMKNVFYQYPIL